VKIKLVPTNKKPISVATKKLGIGEYGESSVPEEKHERSGLIESLEAFYRQFLSLGTEYAKVEADIPEEDLPCLLPYLECVTALHLKELEIIIGEDGIYLHRKRKRRMK